MRALTAGLLLLAGSAQALQVAQMQPRDIDRDGRTDAYYDPQTSLTWLADLNPTCPNNDYALNPSCGATFFRPSPTFDFLGLTWRAPRGSGHCAGDAISQYTCVTDVWEHPPDESFHLFVNEPKVQYEIFWLGTTVQGIPSAMGSGTYEEMLFPGWVMWVRDGDVQTAMPATIPEPSTYALMLAGVAFLLNRQNRRRRETFA